MLRKLFLMSLGVFLLTVGMVGCGSNPSVIDPDALSAEEAAELKKANEDYERYMNESE